MNDNAVQDFVKALKEDTQEPSKTYGAYVSHIDDEGVVWVRIAGAETETPTASRSAEVKPNDYVNVEWRNNKLYIAGNTTNPSAGVARVLNVEAAAATAQDAANSAVADAGRAREAADEARATANSVHGIAVEAQTDAGIAKASATNASEYAARALGNLSTVQSVTETLNWITAHGTMTLTTDTALDPTHVYFVRDADGDYEVGEYNYSVVTEPDVQYINTYYVLSIDESLNNYVGTHLSVTSEGLWLIPDSGGNKVLIATGGQGHTYDTAGTYIIGSDGSPSGEIWQSEPNSLSDDWIFDIDYTLPSGTEIKNYITVATSTVYSFSFTVGTAETHSDDYGEYIFDGDNTISYIADPDVITSNQYAYAVYYIPRVDAVLAEFTEDGAQVGLDGESHLNLDYHSMQLIDKEGSAYFYVSDLRDKNGEATITEVFTGDGNTTSFTVQFLVSTEVSAVDSSDETNTASKRNSVYTFLRAPADGATVTIVYKTMSDRAKAFTIGTRNPLYNVGAFSIVEGVNNIASNYGSYAEGFHTESTGMASHAEGNGTTASGAASHAEGSITDAVGRYSHAEGRGSYAKGDYSHAEGQVTYARGLGAHAEGVESEANKYASHAEGNNTIADGDNSHAQNEYTIAGKNGQTAVGTYNKRDSSATTTHPSNTAEYGKYSVIIGNGTADDARSNALTVDWLGGIEMYLDHNGTSSSDATSGTDKDLFNAIRALGWYSSVIV